MARENIDIGIQGNDGTGDSIRESFRKVNDNFIQLFAVFGSGDRIGFTDLDDTPSSYSANQVIVADSDGANLVAKDLVGGEGIAVDHTDENEIRIISTGGKISNDAQPSLGSHLNASNFSIGNIADPSEETLSRFLDIHPTLEGIVSEDNLVISKGYADQRYLQASGGNGGGNLIRVRSEPEDTLEYDRVIEAWVDGRAVLTNHGFNRGSNGIAFRYIASLQPATGLTINNVYYLRYYDKDELTVHPTAPDAVNGTNQIIVNVPEQEGRGTEIFRDAFYNSELLGNWLSNEALPRYAVTRRQGDVMTGALTLFDHPGSLAGSGTPNGPDDLQAATKFYVDSSSFASTANLFVATSGNDLQTNTPPGKEGRALAYAYETIGAACAKAEELIAVSLTEPGPYRQLITYGNYNNFSYLNSFTTGSGDRRTLKIYTNGAGVDQSKNVSNRDLREGSIIKGIRSGATGKVIDYQGIVSLDDIYVVELLHKETDITNFQTDFFNSADKIEANKSFIVAEVVAYIRSKYPSLVFDYNKWENDFGVILDKLVSDMYYGGNKKSIEEAKRYWNGVASVLPLIQKDSFVDGIDYINLLSQEILADNIIPTAPDSVSFGKRTTETQITISSVSEEYSDIVVSRLISSVKNIVSNGVNGDGTMLEFLEDEQLEFGQPVPEQQISIRVESGIYYEQLPIRVPTNVSIKGDEFRRSIVRPAAGQSTSPWVGIYFYRDETIDGLTRTYVSQSNAASSSGNVVTLASGDVTGLETGMYIKIITGVGEISELCQVTRLITTTSFEISEIPEVAISSATIRGLNSSGLSPIGENFGYHYLVDPSNSQSPPKANKDMDVFLLNDGTILRNITAQGHGGFMCVLDPEGQIQTKSPYFQTATSLSGSINKKAFRGGMFIDGFSGNLPATVTGRTSNSEITLGGLTRRKPGIPTSFYINGERYQINAVEDYNQLLGTARAILDESTPWPINDPATSSPWTYPYSIIIETPGNRSMLCNDFTQINDLGYGIVATNNGLCEAVSVFTYYNHISYLANNGAQIRSVTGSSCNGVYGLKAAGRDPNEVPDPVILADNTLQAAKIYRRGSFASKNVLNDQSIYIDNYEYIPNNISEIEIDHTNTRSAIQDNSDLSPNNIVITNGGSGYTVGEFFEVDGGTLFTVNAKARFRVTEIGGGGAVTEVELIEEGDYSIPPANPFTTTSETIGGGSGCEISAVFKGDIVVYEISNVENTTSVGTGVDFGGVPGIRPVLKLNLNAESGEGIRAPLADGQVVIIRSLQNLRFTGVEEIRPVRPSTALEFTAPSENGVVYRTLAYNLAYPTGETLLETKNISSYGRDSGIATITTSVNHGLNPGDLITVSLSNDASFNALSTEILSTPSPDSFTYNNTGLDVIPAQSGTGTVTYSDQAILSFDTSFSYTILQTKQDSLSDVDYVVGGPKTMGANIGDTRIAVVTIFNQRSKDRLNSGTSITSWAGKLHRVVGYTEPAGGNSAYIEIDDYAYGSGTIVTGGPTGLAEGFTDSRSTNIRVGLAEGANAEITVRISTCRATGHDFLDVGSGGFNSTNYPNNLLGAPISEPNSENIVVEETQGRVFHVSTDQDGIFRVGRFFEVDQGTGTVTFSASIALSNLDGIGFKRGTVVKEFSTDDTFTDNAEDSVPTESAIRGYIDRRLGRTHNGGVVPLAERIPSLTGGFLPVDNDPTLEDDLSMGSTVGHRITNLVTNPASSTDAANVQYVDDQIDSVDTWYKLNEVLLMNPESADVAVFLGNGNIVVNSTATGDISFTLGSSTSSTLTNAISTLNQSEVNYGVVVEDITGFPTSGYFKINNEIFSYTGTTPASNRFDGVIRAVKGSVAQIHNSLSPVISLDNSTLDLQIKSGVIVDADVNATAAIQQSKLAMLNATAGATAGGSIKGIASFDSDNFVASGGWISIKSGGVSLGDLQNIADGRILGNLSGSATAPYEISTDDLVEDGINNLFTAIDSGSNVMTRRVNSLKGSTTFTSISGTSPVGSGTINNVSTVSLTGLGNGALFTVTYSGGVYTSITCTYGGNGYSEGNQLFIAGDLLGGISPGNDLQFTIATTGTNIDSNVYLGIQKVSVAAEANSIIKTDSNKNLGKNSQKFNNIYATNFVGNADTATKSSNLIGSTIGSIPYQNAADTTVFLSPGTNGYFLKSQGTGAAPTWAAIPDGTAESLTGTTLSSSIVSSSLSSFADLITLGTAVGIVAAGTDLATATVLSKNINVISTVATGTGIRFPSAVAGYRLLIRNSGFNNLNLYPSAGASINDGAEGDPVTIEPGAALEYFCAQSESGGTGGRWYSINATFA
jgi:hypothetical protein